MSVTKEEIRAALERLELPDGGTLVSRDMLRALTIEGGTVRFVIEAPSPQIAGQMEPLRRAAQACVAELPGVEEVSVVLTAHGPAQVEPQKAAPSLKLGGHPKPQAAPMKPSGVKRILAIASGKGASANPLSAPISLWPWRGWGARSACWTQIYTVPRSRA